MGTFGTGPFSNDGALDLLDELARQTTDQLAAIFFREQHSQDQELPFEL